MNTDSGLDFTCMTTATPEEHSFLFNLGENFARDSVSPVEKTVSRSLSFRLVMYYSHQLSMLLVGLDTQ